MSEAGTGYIIQIDVETRKQSVNIRDVDFGVDFYVYPNRRKHFSKRELVHVAREDGDWYFAMLDSSETGPGKLRAKITIKDPVKQWAGGIRPVVIDKYTGKHIGKSDCPTPYAPQTVCEEWDEGYKVTFNFVSEFPKAEVAYIFYGHLVDQITSFADITQDMLVNPENHIVSVSAGKMGKTSVGVMNEGARVVVLIPEDTSYVATKDNGIGGKVKFNESLLGANGQQTVTIDSTTYRVYGELLTTEGEMFVYVD